MMIHLLIQKELMMKELRTQRSFKLVITTPKVDYLKLDLQKLTKFCMLQ